MKKIYKNPVCKVVILDSSDMMAESNVTYYNEEGDGDQLVKENVSSRLNLWDDEW